MDPAGDAPGWDGTRRVRGEEDRQKKDNTHSGKHKNPPDRSDLKSGRSLLFKGKGV